jgi:hypothetical protein
VIRENPLCKHGDQDPAYGTADSTYASYLEEIQARAPIKSIDAQGNPTDQFDSHYKLDNVHVWKILSHTLKDTGYMTHIKPYQRLQNGREAYKALHKTLLGREAVNNYISRAENRLTTLTLDGARKKNWNFDKYVLAHKSQHVRIDKIQALNLYSGIDESSKIRHFLRGITDPKLESVRASISTTPKAKFDEVVETYRTYMEGLKENKREPTTTLNVSAISHNGNRSADKVRKFGEKEDGYDPSKDYSQHKIAQRFYKTPEWNKLTKGQRNYLRANSKKPKGRNSFNAERAINEMRSEMVELLASKLGKRKTSKKRKEVSDTDSDASTDDEPSSKRTRIFTKSRG